MNKVLFKVHTWLAIIACLPLVLIGLSGSLLVFKHDIDTLLGDRARLEVGERRLSLDLLMAEVHKRYPANPVVGWEQFSVPERADRVTVLNARGARASFEINPYSGDVLSEPVSGPNGVTDWLLKFHSSLLLGEYNLKGVGLLVTGLAAVALCLLGLSGLILRRRFWLGLFKLRYRARRVLYFSDLHKMLGVLSAPVLLVLGFTGAYWNLPFSVHELQRSASASDQKASTMPSPAASQLASQPSSLSRGGTFSLQALLDDSVKQIPGFEPSYVSLPSSGSGTVRILGENTKASRLYSRYGSSVTYDSESVTVNDVSDIRDAAWQEKIENSFRRLHFGTFGGRTSQIVWCLVGLMPGMLAGTGLYLWFSRRPQRSRLKMRVRVQNTS